MKILSLYPGWHEVWSSLAEFFESLDKVSMWCYNILGDNEGSISHILQPDPITPGSILITYNLVLLKSENDETILTVKIIEWREFNSYFGLSVGADPSRVGKNNVYIFHIVYTPSPSYVISI